jgi:hypothetical protein
MTKSVVSFFAVVIARKRRFHRRGRGEIKRPVNVAIPLRFLCVLCGESMSRWYFHANDKEQPVTAKDYKPETGVFGGSGSPLRSSALLSW